MAAPGARRWLASGGLGALCVAAGYVLFVPALPHYQPLAPGTTNRMNVLAAVGYAVLVYALVRLAFRRVPIVAAFALIAIGVGYAVQVIDDRGGWERSTREQQRVLASIPRPPPGTTVYTFRAPTFAAPGVPVFSLPFDLKAAVRLRYDNPSLAAYPIASSARWIQCGADGPLPDRRHLRHGGGRRIRTRVVRGRARASAVDRDPLAAECVHVAGAARGW